MEEDNTQYYNDEWNPKWIKFRRSNNLVKYQQLNELRQLSCQCNLPRPNSFTGNCINCNKIIKPLIDRNVNKYTK